ncbi:MAG: hypothetical protein JW834_00415 [Candidatus Diapherotrites archaeon]|nr:hypothetical protein [Candidatus Diapherotrites archaeon]
MPEKPKILQIVTDMRVEGMSDDDIVKNLKQLGLSDDQIKKIMKVADQDIYSKFKREMAQFIEERIKKSAGIIESLVDPAVDKRLEKIKKEVMEDAQQVTGDFAKTVNEKTNDMAIAVKKVREENKKLLEDQKLARQDIDLLLGGPSKFRMGMSIAFLAAGVLVLAYTIFSVTPQVIALDFTNPTDGVVLLVTGAVYILVSIVLLTIGVYFTGKPGRQ